MCSGEQKSRKISMRKVRRERLLSYYKTAVENNEGAVEGVCRKGV